MGFSVLVTLGSSYVGGNMGAKNRHARALQRLGVRAIRKKYGPDFWKQIRAGEKPSERSTTQPEMLSEPGEETVVASTR
jgi:hypothetical protein